MPEHDDTDTADFNVAFIEPLDDMPDDEIHDIDGMLDSDDEDTLEVYAAYQEYQLLGVTQGAPTSLLLFIAALILLDSFVRRAPITHITLID